MKHFLLIAALFGATLAVSSQKSLQDDFKEFVDLIPVEKLKQITCNYKDDSEVQAAIQYLRSKEFAILVAAVREKNTWIEFKEYLNNAGINVEEVIAAVHNIITHGVCNSATSSRSLRDFINDLKAALPLNEIRTLIIDKMENSADFQIFYGKISSDKSRDLVEEVIALEEFQRVVEQLEVLGFDMKKVKVFIYELLGWK